MIVPELAYVEKKVAAVERLQTMIDQHQERLRELLLPYVGKKARNVDGSLIKPLRDGVEKARQTLIADNNDSRRICLHCYIEASPYSLFLYIGMDLHDAKYPSSVESLKADRYVARFENGILTKVEDRWKREPINADTVHQWLTEYKDAKDKMESIRSSLYPYFSL
jgi:hypothetical protein